MHKDEPDESESFNPERTQPLGDEAQVIATTHAAEKLELSDSEEPADGYDPYDTLRLKMDPRFHKKAQR